MRRSKNVVIAAVFLAVLAQPPLTNIQPRSLDQLKREFNATSDRVRVILLLSPT